MLSAVGIALAAAMLSAALVIADGLGRGFDRAARAADLPDLLVRFDPVSAHTVARRITALPDVAAYSLRLELTNVGIAATGHRRGDAVAEVIGPGRRTGYAIVAGRDLRPVGSEVLLERGVRAGVGRAAWGTRSTSTGSGLSVSSGSSRRPTTSAFRSPSRASTCLARRSTPASAPSRIPA